MTAEPVVDFFGFHRVGGTTSQFPDDQIHPACESAKVALVVGLVPLLRFLAKFGDGDWLLSQVAGKFYSRTGFRLLKSEVGLLDQRTSWKWGSRLARRSNVNVWEQPAQAFTAPIKASS